MCYPSKSAASDAVFAASTPRDKRSDYTSAAPTIKNPNNEKSKSSKLSSWKEERQQQIDALNSRVEKLTTVAVEDSKKSGKPLALEYVHAQHPMTTLVAGAPVYQMRSATLVYLYLMGTSTLVLLGMTKLSFAATALCMVTMFVGYDLYSGILHVVLDHPSNIALPIMGQPCLEFQWHHAIPEDLVRKDFVDVCGDLNLVVFITVVINLLFIWGGLLNYSGVAMVFCGMKLPMAYFGQFSHRSAHSFGKSRSPVADWLQRCGFMISPKEHMAHHKPPHDLDFCLIGLCNPIIDALRKVTTNNAIWLTAFFILSVFDLVVYAKFVEYVITKLPAYLN